MPLYRECQAQFVIKNFGTLKKPYSMKLLYPRKWFIASLSCKINLRLSLPHDTIPLTHTNTNETNGEEL